ncbi:MAG: type II toxin-antitoxin system HicB family antitoxin [Dehalococcoidia bacterium]|nr:type II toxin-antitoxin system HicB family antitoxin [Dehalococcoidia bacterium]
MRKIVYATIWPGEELGYVAECPDLSVVTQGRTLDEVAYNLQEACGLALEDGGAEDLGVHQSPTIVVTMALEPLVATV